jgi:outer membrane autotransporter protein
MAPPVTTFNPLPSLRGITIRWFLGTILSLSLITSAQSVELFNPYVGLNAGLLRMKSQNKAAVSVEAGNTFKFGSFYVEPAVKFNALNNKIKFKKFNNATIKDFGSVDLNFGYNIMDDLLFFVSANESYISAKDTKSHKENKFVFGYGVGLRYSVNDNISFATKFNNKQFKKFGVKYSEQQMDIGVRYTF